MTLTRLLMASLRVRQWVKNLVMLAPLLFSGKGNDLSSVVSSILSVFLMCLASSSAYLFNDLVDHEVDGFHPSKKARPVASGRLPRSTAINATGLLTILAVGGSWWWRAAFGILVTAFVFLNATYSLVVKRWVILDVIALSLGYVIRVWGGAVVIDVVPSQWLVLSLFFLALFMSLTKRRQELLLLEHDAHRHRAVLSEYNPAFLDQLIAMVTSVTILCYALYTVSPDVTQRLGPWGLLVTVPMVIYGIFRYLHVVYVQHHALDPTEAVLSDRPLLFTVGLWTLSIVMMLYR